jgi:hypothetical protein
MTSREQIAYLRDVIETGWRNAETKPEVLAVCDLAERALTAERALEVCQTKCDRLTIRYTLNADEAEAVRDIPPFLEREYPVIVAVLRRLLGDTP